MSRRALVVMAKVPKPGRVKTRMCPPLSFEQAAELYRAFSNDVLDAAEAVRAELGCELWVLLAAEDPSELDEVSWPAHVNVRLQEGRGLGSRIQHAHRTPGADEVVVIGTDSPQMDPRRIVSAFDAIARGFVVVGPVRDGGYDLIGARDLAEELVSEEIPWSTSGVLAATRAAARRTSARLLELGTEADIDELADLEHVLAHAPADALRHTRPAALRILHPRDGRG
ncbi:MAG: TIGR04282 family arsenosugar biosynthesis glycosyltransferase [Deltaproteobacteria bacterium]|nr:TIGR04282 family arsenosugar biosynthesis glycosyltransferase [Deltaproteobacteria bacterium]